MHNCQNLGQNECRGIDGEPVLMTKESKICRLSENGACINVDINNFCRDINDFNKCLILRQGQC